MKLRECLEQGKTWTLTTKTGMVNGKEKVVEFTLTTKAKGVETAVYEVWGHITAPKK